MKVRSLAILLLASAGFAPAALADRVVISPTPGDGRTVISGGGGFGGGSIGGSPLTSAAAQLNESVQILVQTLTADRTANSQIIWAAGTLGKDANDLEMATTGQVPDGYAVGTTDQIEEAILQDYAQLQTAYEGVQHAYQDDQAFEAVGYAVEAVQADAYGGGYPGQGYPPPLPGQGGYPGQVPGQGGYPGQVPGQIGVPGQVGYPPPGTTTSSRQTGP